MPGPVSAAALSRRNVLIASGATALGAGLGFALVPGSGDATAAPPLAEPVTGPASGLPAAPTSPAAPAAARPYTAGTTLHSVAAPRGRGGYRRLGDGPGWKRVTRTELAAAGSGRAAHRTSLSCFVQFTDLHLTDVQNPQRYEFLRSAASAGWRPQEALTNAGAVSLVERVNALRYGPATGTPIGFVMTTGDNTDNNSRIELDWFLAVMSGGRFTPDSGDPGHYEGVQDSGLKGFWQPDAALRDADKAAGYPRLPGFLAAAVRELNSPGLNVPWYSTIGNHDQLYGGSYAASSFFHDLALGSRKLFWLPPAEAEAVNAFLRQGPDPQGTRFREAWNRHKGSARTVTPDGRRAPVTPREYIAAHLDPAHAGAGPVGHGYTTAELDSGRLHYAFRISDGVLGISLDTTDRGGDYRGSLGTDQMNWLDRTLTAHADDTVLVFSHHPSWSMTNLVRDPARPGERRRGARAARPAPRRRRLDQRAQPQEQDRPARHLLGGLHRLPRRLSAAGPDHRADRQPRRHALAALHARGVRRSLPHRLLRPVADRARRALPRARVQRAGLPYDALRRAGRPQRGTAAEEALTARVTAAAPPPTTRGCGRPRPSGPYGRRWPAAPGTPGACAA